MRWGVKALAPERGIGLFCASGPVAAGFLLRQEQAGQETGFPGGHRWPSEHLRQLRNGERSSQAIVSALRLLLQPFQGLYKANVFFIDQADVRIR